MFVDKGIGNNGIEKNTQQRFKIISKYCTLAQNCMYPQ